MRFEMAEQGKTKWIELTIRLSFVALLVVAGGFLLSRERPIDMGDIIGLTLLGAAVAGIEVKRWLNGGGGSSTAVGGAVLLMFASAISGCAGHPCLAERSTVAALGVAVELAEGAIPEGVDGRDEALDAARAAVQLGAGAVDGCEVLRDNAGWRAWLAIAVDVVGVILDLVQSRGMAISPDIVDMLESVEDALGESG